ncbi:Phosphatidylinositol 4-kinase alpha, partial [Nowakowskiella sp. JEL0078]
LAEETVDILSDILEDAEGVFGDPVSMETYLTVIEGLGVLSIHRKTLDILTNILTTPSQIFFSTSEESALTAARQCASSVLCNALRILKVSSNTKTHLFTFINSSQSAHTELISGNSPDAISSKNIIYLNTITAIAAITPVLKPRETIEIAIPVIARRLEEPNPKAEQLLWDSLGNIGLTCEDIVFREIVSFVLQHKMNFVKVSRTSHTLARMSGRPIRFYKTYLECILTVFIDRAAGLQKNSTDTLLLSELRELSNLVRIICDRPEFQLIIERGESTSQIIMQSSEGINGTENEDSTSEDLFSLIRNFWLYCSIYILQPNGQWPRDWSYMLISIAAKTPPLLLVGTTRTLEAELGSHSILKAKMSEGTASKVKNTFAVLLPGVSYESRNLSFFQCAYLLTVYQIESLRAKRNCASFLVEYLKDEKLYGTEIYTFLEVIAEEIAKSYTKEILVLNPTGPIITEYMEMLIFESAHRLGRVRRFASKTINHVIKVIPATLWNSNLFSMMLDVLQYLDGVGNVGKEHRGERERRLQKHAKGKLEFVNQLDAIGAKQDFYELTLGWILMANKKSTSETTGLLARYLVEIDIKFPDLTASKNSLLTRLINKFYSHPDTDITVNRSLGKSALYMGEIRGMISVMGTLNGGTLRSTELQISERIQSDLRLLVSKESSTIKSQDMQNLNALLNQAAALIISTEDIDEELLHCVSWTPVLLFSPPVMDIAVPVWTWISTARPDVTMQLLDDL